MLGGTKHHFVTTPSVGKEILNLRTEITNRDFALFFMKNFWGDGGKTSQIDPEPLWKSIHPVLFQLNRDPFLSKALPRTTEAVEDMTVNLVSFNRGFIDQAPWERKANVVIPSGSSDVAEVDLYPLIRDFVGHIACNILMGEDFQKNNPDILADLWTLDAKLMVLMGGVPGWLPGLRDATAARIRIVDAVVGHHQAILDMLAGKDAGPLYSDDLLSDCSRVMVERAKAYHAAGVDIKTMSAGDGSILWAMMVNANQVIFWLLFHAYSSPTLLADLRAEISPYVKVEPIQSQLSVKPPPKVTIDIKALQHSCPLFQASFLETMRVNTLSTSTKTILEPFSITESPSDAQIQGYQVPRTYEFRRPQDILWVAHAVHQKDPRYWTEPLSFQPKRFFADDFESARQQGKLGVDYKTMKVWGGGPSMCKGKGFAEGEVAVFAAAILTLWDVEKVGDGGKWVDPGRKTGGGTAQPINNIRVRLSRRRF